MSDDTGTFTTKTMEALDPDRKAWVQGIISSVVDLAREFPIKQGGITGRINHACLTAAKEQALIEVAALFEYRISND